MAHEADGEALLKRAVTEHWRQLTPPQLETVVGCLIHLGDVQQLLARVSGLDLGVRLQIIEAFSAHSLAMSQQIELIEGMDQDEAARQRAADHYSGQGSE